MSKTWLIGILVVGVIALGGVVYGHGMSGYGMMGSGYAESWYGRNTGPMMGTGDGWGCPMGQYSGGYYGRHRSEILTKNDAETVIRDYLYRLGNPNLKQGKITETDHEFKVQIVTKDNSLVETLSIDKETGCMRQAN
jgi:hypothetical protein